MNDEYVLITGSSSGIGWATALHLDDLGYRVVAGVRKSEDAERLQASASGRLVPVLLDVTKACDVEAAWVRVRELSGEGGLKALINNAGHNYNSAFEHSDDALARKMMEVNFFGLVRTTQRFIPLLRQHARHGDRTAKLINVGSIGSLLGLPWESFYHASKFAVLGLTESLRHELFRQGIRATAVLPGGIKTEFARKTGSSVALAQSGMDDEGRQLYGVGLQRISDMVSLTDRWGSDPQLVARRIGRIVRHPNPGLKYLIGIDARLMQAMSILLPTKLMHRVLRLTFAA